VDSELAIWIIFVLTLIEQEKEEKSLISRNFLKYFSFKNSMALSALQKELIT